MGILLRLANRKTLYVVLALLGILVIAWAFRKHDTASDVIPTHASELHGQAQANASESATHAQQADTHESEAAAHHQREQELQARIAKLKREVDELKQHPNLPVGGTDATPGGDTGNTGGADSPLVRKLEQTVSEQGSLITELQSDNQSLRLALSERKAEANLLNLAYSKEAQANLELQARIKQINAEVRSETTRAEVRGGVKGFALGVLLKSLIH